MTPCSAIQACARRGSASERPVAAHHAARISAAAAAVERAEGLAATGDLYERYLTGPETSPNPADWRTELNQPLTG